MKQHRISRAAAVLAILGTAIFPPIAARADAVADFYKGRTVTVVVTVSAGGVYGIFAQILEKHLAKHIPGNPTVILNYMEGAGGVRALNYIYNAAPKDGAVFVTPTTGNVLTAVMEPNTVKYDPLKFAYLGAWGEAVNVLSVINTAPVKSLQDALKTEVIMGSVGRNTSSYQFPALLNETLGAKFKIITGYGGGAQIRLAMERGEVHGWGGLWLGWFAAAPDWIRDNRLVHLVQMASKPPRELGAVPRLIDLARTDEQRAIFAFLTATGLTGNTFMAPPGVPPDRVAAMEKAYRATLDDPAFRADAAARNYTIDPLTGAEVRAAVERIVATPKDIIEKTKKAMGM